MTVKPTQGNISELFELIKIIFFIFNYKPNPTPTPIEEQAVNVKVIIAIRRAFIFIVFY
jgi:hypothetical protein